MDTSASPSTNGPRLTPARRVVTVVAAVAVLAGGLLHLRTWDTDYREIPDGAVPGLWVIKAGFPVNALVSVVLAAALIAVALGALASIRRVIVAAVLALQVGSIAALVISRGPGLFGWTEKGYESDAVTILVAEVLTTALLVAALVLDRRAADENI